MGKSVSDVVPTMMLDTTCVSSSVIPTSDMLVTFSLYVPSVSATVLEPENVPSVTLENAPISLALEPSNSSTETLFSVVYPFHDTVCVPES